MARRHIMESTFRLNLLNPQHAKINEVIKGLNPKIYKSKNQFLIEACEFYIDHYGEDDIPSKEEKRYEQFVTRDEIEQIKKEIEYSAMTEARKEVISLLGGALAGVKNSQPVMVASPQEDMDEQPEDYEMQIQQEVLRIWDYLYREYRKRPHAKAESAVHLERLREMLSYMEQNYSRDINLDDIAAHVNICKSECCRFFKKHMDMTILEYLMSLRIQKSIPLLKKGKSVAETAGLVGFASPAYFGQIFKRYMHCTPKSIQK